MKNKKSELYTLQRFYHEAKALAEKYKIDDYYKHFLLDVSFNIKERIKSEISGTIVDFTIVYGERDYNDKRTYHFGSSPHHCLSDFEQTLRQHSGMQLIDSVAVELQLEIINITKQTNGNNKNS
jgi:hypothetical protein